MCCHHGTDTQRSYCSTGKVKVSNILNTSLCSSFSSLPLSLLNKWREAGTEGTCSGSRRNRAGLELTMDWNTNHCLSWVLSKTSMQMQIYSPFISTYFPWCHTPSCQDGGLLHSHLALTLCSMWRTLPGPSCDKGPWNVLFKASWIAKLSPVTWHGIQIAATRSASEVHTVFPLVLKALKSRTKPVEAACVKWAPLHKHSLLEKYKPIESLLWNQRACAIYLYVPLHINSILKMAASFPQETFPPAWHQAFNFLNPPVTPVPFPFNSPPQISQSHQVFWSILTCHLQSTVTLCSPRSQQFSSGLYHCTVPGSNTDFVCSHKC